jgi:hypothetical protein
MSLAPRSSGQITPSPHCGLAWSMAFEDENGPSDEKAEHPDRERDDVAHQDTAGGRHSGHPPYGTEFARVTGSWIGGHVKTERDATKGDHKQEKPDSGQNEAHLRILPDVFARFTRKRDSFAKVGAFGE